MISLKCLTKILAKNRFSFCRFISTQSFSPNVSDNCNTDNEKVVSFDDFKCLIISKKIEYQIKIILNEYEVYRNSDLYKDRIPSRLTVSMVKQLLNCENVRRKGRAWIDLSYKQRQNLLYLMKKSEDIGGQNQLIAPIMKNELEKLYENRLRSAALFGQNIVFDLSFDNYMSISECKNLAEQLNRIYKFNRYGYLKYCSGELPFNLYLCNVDKSGQTFNFLKFLYPHIISDKSFVNITTDSYSDVFPKPDLVYLSPHAEDVMTEYDNNAVFIIGGIVDRKQVITLSQPKAVQQNIRSVRLPIDSLTIRSNIQALDSVFGILFDLKAFGAINQCISFEDRIRRHIPKFKLKSSDQMSYEKLKSQQFIEYSDYFDEQFETKSDFKCNKSVL